MSTAKALKLQAGTLIEPDEADDSQKLPSRRQLAKLETDWDKIPTSEHIRRLYRRHIVGLWQTTAVLAIAGLIWSVIA